MAGFDAVLVGSGINTLTAAALLARDGWSVCVLERSDRLGGAIRTEADYTLPGFTHEVMSSWHPLFTGSPAYAELGDELAPPRARVPQHGSSDATAFPDGEAMFLRTSLEDNVAEFERFAGGDGAAWQRQFEGFMANADLSFGVLGTELWSAAGLGARPADAAPLRSPRAARVRGARALDVPRLDDDDLRLASRRTACSRPGCSTRGSAPSRRSRGS